MTDELTAAAVSTAAEVAYGSQKGVMKSAR